MVANQMILWRFPYLDNAILQPSKIKPTFEMNILKEFELRNKIQLCNRPLPGSPFTSGLNHNRK